MRMLVITLIILLTNTLLFAQDVEESLSTVLPEIPQVETDEDDSNWAGEQTLYFGISFKLLAIAVNQVGPGTNLGTMMENPEPSVLFGYNTKSYHFKGTDWGWKFSTNGGVFNIHTQDISSGSEGSDIEDVGTSVRGEFFHFSPVFFYHRGDRELKSLADKSLLVGIGVGASYLSLKGTVELTHEAIPSILDVDVGGLTFAVMLFFEGRIGPWMLRMTNGGPALIEDGKAYLFGDMSIDMGYAVSF